MNIADIQTLYVEDMSINMYGYRQYIKKYSLTDLNGNTTNLNFAPIKNISSEYLELFNNNLTWNYVGVVDNTGIGYNLVDIGNYNIYTSANLNRFDASGYNEAPIVTTMASNYVPYGMGYITEDGEFRIGGLPFFNNTMSTLLSSSPTVYNYTDALMHEYMVVGSTIVQNSCFDKGATVMLIADNVASAAGLTPNKLAVGNQVLNITGTYTSDANAVAINIRNGATAYVNGQKIVGTLPNLRYPTNPNNPSDSNYQFIAANNNLKNITREGVMYIVGEYQIANASQPDSWMFEGNRKMKMGFAQSNIASLVGLVPNKLKSGETILGVTGNYTGDTSNLEPIVAEQENIIINLQSTVNNLQNIVNNKCLPEVSDFVVPSSYIYSNLPNKDLSFKGMDFSNINAIGVGINHSNISLCNSFLIAHCANLVNISDINFNNIAFTSTNGIQNTPYLALNCPNVRRFSNIAFPFLSTILHPILATNISTGQQFFENIFLPNLTNINTSSIFWGNSTVPIEIDGLFLNKYNGSNPIIDNIPVQTLKNIYAPNISNIKMLCNNGLVQNAVLMNLNLCGITSTATGLAGMRNLQTFSMINLYNVSNAELMFASCNNLENVEFHNASAGVAPLGWGQSNVHVAKMLYGCNNLSDLSIYNILNYFSLMSQSNRLNTQCKSLNTQNGNSPFFSSNIITRAEQLSSCAQILATMRNNGWTY